MSRSAREITGRMYARILISALANLYGRLNTVVPMVAKRKIYAREGTAMMKMI